MRPRHAQETPRQWRKYWAALRVSDRDAVPDRLGPAEAFADARGDAAERQEHGLEVPASETGRRSRTVKSRLRLSCAGWRTEPTAAEFYQAVHNPDGTGRETAILLTWYHEGDITEKVHARLEGAYSWQELVRALHRAGLTHGNRAQELNRFATR